MIQVAVISHARADKVSDRTLALLDRHGLTADEVTVFVAPDEMDAYRATVDPRVARVAEGAVGIVGQHNAVTAAYPEGAWLVHLDDDIDDVHERVDDRTLRPVADLRAVWEEGFRACVEHGTTLWGVYPVRNARFMRDTVTTDLRFCIGQMFGTINSHAPWAQVSLPVKEDYERTLRAWREHGAVVRLNRYACATKMYAPGGIGPDRQARNRAAVRALAREFPEHVRIKAKRSDAGLEIRLVN